MTTNGRVPDDAVWLVTGANGFVGRALCEVLRERGQPMRAVVRGAAHNLATATNVAAVGSIGPETDWSATLDGIGAVVHLAARVHVMHENAPDALAAFRQVNTHGTLNLARQASVAGVKRFVFMSSVKVNGERTQPGRAFTEADPPMPQDSYGLSKDEAERGLHKIGADTGMEVVVIRPPLVYGPGVKANFDALIRGVRRGLILPLGVVDNRRSLVALGNLIDFITTCVTHPLAANQTFLVSDGNDLSTPDLIRGLARAAGVASRLLPVPLLALQIAAALVGKRDMLGRLCGNLQVDIAKARGLLQWTPPLSVDEGLRSAMTASENA